MKPLLLGLLLLISITFPAQAEDVLISLSPAPYDFVVPHDIAGHLSTGPLTGTWAEQVKAYGVLEAVSVYYQPAVGDKTILFSAYHFDEETWDAAQTPGEPPPFGQEVFRGNGTVFSIDGPQDSIYDPETLDGRNVVTLSELLRKHASFRAME